jgi:mannose-1-phosphate guanylyltransferase
MVGPAAAVHFLQVRARTMMQAMILAAGFGTRLRPHSLIRPKPLFPVLNQPLLLLTVKRLQNMGFDRIVVNCHHLREQIVSALDGIEGVIVQQEESILGTGGGLRRALKHFDDTPLLVTNGDIYHTLDFKDMYRFHLEQACPVTLAMHNNDRFNTVMVQDGEIVSFDVRRNSSLLAFTGIHMIDPLILRDISEHSYSCIIDHYRKLISDGVKIGCYQADYCFWTDMGCPEDYLRLHEGLLKKRIPSWSEMESGQGPFLVDERVRLSSSVALADWVCAGNRVMIGEGSCLERVIVWDGVSIGAGSRLADEIVSSPDSSEKEEH